MKVFISYRRSDSADATARVHDHLEMYFGEDIVFRDIDQMKGGDDFLRGRLLICSPLLSHLRLPKKRTPTYTPVRICGTGSKKALDTFKIGDKDEAAAFTNLSSAYRWSRMD